MTPSPQEAAYWLHLAYGVDRPTRRETNALVLNAHRREGLGLLDLVRLDPRALPASLAPYADTLAAVQAAEGKIAGQAFIAADLERRRISLLPITSDAYPAHLARLSPAAAPTVLLVLGDALLLREPGVAISGSRDAGPQGLAFARACGHALAERGIPMVSGLARGVDSEGLEGALEAGGVVIGIAPEGLLVSRWATDRRLQGGLVVISERSGQEVQALLLVDRRRARGIRRGLPPRPLSAERLGRAPLDERRRPASASVVVVTGFVFVAGRALIAPGSTPGAIARSRAGRSSARSPVDVVRSSSWRGAGQRRSYVSLGSCPWDPAPGDRR